MREQMSHGSVNWSCELCCVTRFWKVIREKRDCGSLHCVTAGSRGKKEREETGGGEQGHSEGGEGREG
ncbi:hypothetical protein EYF80_011639 [Liparis tanakae]|uniref:Uncharacterized protein n=1 Tax=Liparis tanakae TaxID=230148 RepID=A0A4Z2IKX9_9TELE|nr:hypothetical protein EYF80_011639 [Liparis tanakae]